MAILMAAAGTAPRPVTEQNLWALIALIGLFAQIGITALLWLFFQLLKQHVGRRARFFKLWTYCWAVLLVALATLVFGLYGLAYLGSSAAVVGLLPGALL